MFNKLPVLWLVEFVLLWLSSERTLLKNDKSLARLDMAFCNKSQRPHWLKLLSSDYFLIKLFINSNTCFEGYAEWLSVRSIKPHSILLICTITTEKFSKSMTSLNVSKVRTIYQSGKNDSKRLCSKKELRQLLIRCSSI